MGDRASFFAAFEVDHDNWQRYAVFSDWLLEHNEPRLALAFRWCWANRERPRFETYSTTDDYQWLVTVDQNYTLCGLELRDWIGMKPGKEQTFEDAMDRIANGLAMYLSANGSLILDRD